MTIYMARCQSEICQRVEILFLTVSTTLIFLVELFCIVPAVLQINKQYCYFVLNAFSNYFTEKLLFHKIFYIDVTDDFIHIAHPKLGISG